MLLLNTSAAWLLLLAFLGQQLSLSCGARDKHRAAEDHSVTPAPGRGQRSAGKPAASARGKFSIADKMRCTWSSASVGDTVRLSVKCVEREARVTGGVNELLCHYDAKPQSCPGYLSDNKGFWKQVGRALKRRKGHVCEDERTLKAGMCKRAPLDASFKLDTLSFSANHRETAEEYCSGSWAGVCNFLMSILQSDDC
uniref:Fibroblast growth factor binding protein 1b n=1 Tax=Cyclopterus lumpus TaxID=8103 RepID=A0A8C2ZGT3_CYCLU